MVQSRSRSFYEAFINISVGYIIRITANALILPFFVKNFTLTDNLILGVIYTLISLTRIYLIRRWFNKEDKFAI